MKEISQKDYDQQNAPKMGGITVSKQETVKPTPTAKMQPIINVNSPKNEINIDLSPLEQVVKDNVDVIKSLGAQLQKMSIQPEKEDKRMIFRINRDTRGLIESIEVTDA